MLEATQKEVELEISQLLENGDITAISNISGIGYSYIDQQLNPNDPRQSFIYGTLRIVCALDGHAPERGEALWRLMERIREASKPFKGGTDADTGACNLTKEFGEAIAARFAGKSKIQQLAEAVQVETAARIYKQSLIDEINREKEEFNSPCERFKTAA